MLYFQNKIVSVSFPRSGSQFLSDSLKANLGTEFRWCEGYTEQVDWEHHNMLKTHDFDLEFEPPPWCEVIVQIRHPLECIPSWFNTQTACFGWEDTYQHWREWAPWAFMFWNKFVRRWVLSERPLMVIHYRDLMAHPEHYLKSVMRILNGSLEIKAPPRPRSLTDFRQFRHYRSDDFEWFKTISTAEMRMIGYE